MWGKASIGLLKVCLMTIFAIGTLRSGDPYFGIVTWGGSYELPYLDSLFVGRIGIGEWKNVADSYRDRGIDSFFAKPMMPKDLKSWSLRMLPIDSVIKVSDRTPLAARDREGLKVLSDDPVDSLTWLAIIRGVDFTSWPPRNDSVWKARLAWYKRMYDSWNSENEDRVTVIECWNEPYDGGYRKHVVRSYYWLFVDNPEGAGGSLPLWATYFTPTDSIRLYRVYDPDSSFTIGYLQRVVSGDTSFTDILQVFSNEKYDSLVLYELWTPRWLVPNIMIPEREVFGKPPYIIYSGAFAYSPWAHGDDLPVEPWPRRPSPWLRAALDRWYKVTQYEAYPGPPYGVSYWIKEFFSTLDQYENFPGEICKGITFHIYMDKINDDIYDPYDYLDVALDTFAQRVAEHRGSFPAWFTEWGSDTKDTTETEAEYFYPALHIGHFLRVFDKHRDDPRMPITFLNLYRLKDPDSYGIVRMIPLNGDTIMVPKPAYYVVRTFSEGLRNPPLMTWDSLSTYPYVGGNLCAKGDSLVIVYEKDSMVLYLRYRKDTIFAETVGINGYAPTLSLGENGYGYVVWRSPFSLGLEGEGIFYRYRDTLGVWGETFNLYGPHLIEAGPVVSLGPLDTLHIAFSKGDTLFHLSFPWSRPNLLNLEVVSQKGHFTKVDMEMVTRKLLPREETMWIPALVALSENDTLYLFRKYPNVGWEEVSQEPVTPSCQVDSEGDPLGYLHLVKSEGGVILYMRIQLGMIEPGPSLWSSVDCYEGRDPTPRIKMSGRVPTLVWASDTTIHYELPGGGSYIDTLKNIRIGMKGKDGWEVSHFNPTKVHSLYPEVSLNSEGYLALSWIQGRFDVFRVALDDSSLRAAPGLTVLNPRAGDTYAAFDSVVPIIWEWEAPSLNPSLRQAVRVFAQDSFYTLLDTTTTSLWGRDTVFWEIEKGLSDSLRVEITLEDAFGQIVRTGSGGYFSTR